MIKKYISAFTLTIVLVLIASSLVFAQPTGTDITIIDTDTVTVNAPDLRTDDGGTINTLVVDAVQQNSRWKAYIGNITGSLALSDSLGNTIFNWALDQSDITGEIYSSRSNSVSWGSVVCATGAIISAEETTLSLTTTAVDSISNTFNETTHPTIRVGTTDLTGCPATSTFVNNLREAQGSASFPIALIEDTTNLIYTTAINPSTAGYDGSLFDFQMILANNPAATTPYYFYVELGG